MSKPFGMTADFQIVRPDRTEDAIRDAVVAAIGAGWTPEMMLKEIRSDWHDYLMEKRNSDDAAFKKAKF